MTAIETLLREPAAQAIGWALLHFAWQGTLIGIVAAIALRLMQRSAADVRYVVSAIALALMGTMPLVTGWQAYRATTVSTAVALSTPITQSTPGTPNTPGTLSTPGTLGTPGTPGTLGTRGTLSSLGTLRTPGTFGTPSLRIEAWLPTLVGVWLAGVSLLTVRLLGGWMWVQRMKRHASTGASRELQGMVVRLSRRLHISRTVRLLQSSAVVVPTVIGCLRPVILFPVSALAGMSPTQIESILAHELAHIRRHDYLVNLLQTLLETLLFYHPAVWWLSRRIRDERENCCDDLAVSLCGDPVAYARALADLEEHRGIARPLVMAASGGALLQRIRRLLVGAPMSHAGRGPVWLAGTTVLALVAGIGATVVITAPRTELRSGNTQSTPVPPVAPTPASAATAPVPVAAAASATRAPSATSAAGAKSTASAPSAADAAHSAPSMPSAPSAFAKATADKSAPLAPSETPAAPQSAPSPPSAPSASSAPSTPSAPSTSSLSIHTSGSGQKSSGNMSWSHNGERLEVRYEGEFEFSDDDTDVKRMSPGAQLRISDGGWLRGRSVEFTADASGNITRRFWVGSSERAIDPEGRQWLSQILPRFIRQSAIGAKERAARIFKAQGAAGLLAEITRIEGGWAKRRYFTELFTMNIDPNAARQALEQAGREISSDYELASLLIESGDRLVTNEATRRAYFDAARTIESDYELRRVFGSALKRGPLGNELLVSTLDASRTIASDYELASLLMQIVKQQSIEPARSQFFAALSTIESDYEQRRVLSTLAARPDLSADLTATMLKSVADLNSDYEAAEFLLQISRNAIEGPQRAPFFTAVETLGGAYERGRVLQAVLKRSDISEESVASALRAAGTMPAGYELSQVLQTAARHHAISGPTREMYIKLADSLGQYEQSQALAALARREK